MAPPAPADTIAALATMLPSSAFNVETPGCAPPVPHSDRKPSGAGGTTVAFNEYALADDGMFHALLWTGTVRACAAARIGPPKVPTVPRVSMIRHGVTA